MISNAYAKTLVIACAGLLGAALIALPQRTEALPQSCRVFTYYNNAALETIVGVRTNCPGGQGWGRTSRFREVETIDLRPEGPGGASGPGQLPCEFRARGPADDLLCVNAPIRR